MSHVDEGTIHAYLDGAFGKDDPERARIEAHITTCAQCRSAVEEASRIAQRAAEVLGHIVPDNVRVEPFEAVLAARRNDGRAAAVTPRGRFRVPLTLAATVMLAVTATWFVRQYLPESALSAPESAVQMSEEESADEALESGLRRDQPAPAVGNAADAIAPARNERAASEGRAGAGRASGVAAPPVREQQRAEAKAVEPPPASVVVPPPATPPPAEARNARTSEFRQRTSAETRGLAEAMLDRANAAPAAVFGDIRTGERAPADSSAAVNGTVLALIDSVSWRASTMDSVVARFGAAATLDGLTPDSVHEAILRGVPFARLTYRLDGETAVELLQWPGGAVPDETDSPVAQSAASADADRASSRPDSALRLRAAGVLFGTQRVDLMLRGPLSADSLSVLLKKVRRTP